MTRINPAFLYLIIAAILWGAVVPIMKITLKEIPIFSLIFLRMGFASILLFPLVYKKLRIEKVDWKNTFLAAFLGTNLNLAFFFFGLEHTQAINASVMLATAPVFTLAIAHYLLKEKFSAKLVLGSLLSLAGTVIIVGIPAFHLSLLSTLGNLSLIASSLAWVGHEIYAKKILNKYNPLVVSFYTMAIGAIIFLPVAASELWTNPTWYSHVSLHGFLGLLYGIIFASFIAYSLWQKGLAILSAGEASLIFYLLPLFGIIFSIILLHEKFNAILIVGSLIIVAGIVLAEFHRKTHPLPRHLHS